MLEIAVIVHHVLWIYGLDSVIVCFWQFNRLVDENLLACWFLSFEAPGFGERPPI